MSITRIEVVEVWKKTAKGKITSKPLKMKIYVNDLPMREMSFDELEVFDLLIQFKPLEDFIRERDFKLTIRRVNYETIYGYQSAQIFRALNESPWNKITYVEPTKNDN